MCPETYQSCQSDQTDLAKSHHGSCFLCMSTETASRVFSTKRGLVAFEQDVLCPEKNMHTSRMTCFAVIYDFQTEVFSSESRSSAIQDGLNRIAQGQNVCYELAEYQGKELIGKVCFVHLDDDTLRRAAQENCLNPRKDAFGVNACEHIIRNRERLSWQYQIRAEVVTSFLASRARQEDYKRCLYRGWCGKLRKLRDACCRFCSCDCCSSSRCRQMGGSTVTTSMPLFGSFGAVYGGGCGAATGGGCGGGGGGCGGC